MELTDALNQHFAHDHSKLPMQCNAVQDSHSCTMTGITIGPYFCKNLTTIDCEKCCYPPQIKLLICSYLISGVANSIIEGGPYSYIRVLHN